jgi:ATP phosphoribosyltransferase regulatory subunit
MTLVAENRLHEALLGLFAREGYARAEVGVLQPVEAFLEVSGEDIRKRLFVVQDGEGREQCLRPEYTIPLCQAHLAAGASSGAHAYLGPVFRMRAGESGEFLQAGVESFGRADREAADAEVLALACEGVALAGLQAPQVRLGDVAVLRAALAALKLPASAERRLMRAVTAGKGEASAAVLDEPASDGMSAHAGLLQTIQGQDPQAARRFVEDVLAIAGVSTVGGRTAADIAGRFLARAGELGQGVSAEARAVVGRLLAIGGDPDASSAALRALSADAGIDIAAEIDALEARTGFMAARGLDVGAMRFEAAFARNLDYYTGFIFELHDPAPGSPKPVAGGGRYDGLMERLGASAPVPAVGVSIWLGRLPAGRGEP